ncbi:MAG: CotH kinase family protein, partial [Gemmataceae bacterium]|nr:CotH kinase family protein [Gemmataceae bacterium]
RPGDGAFEPARLLHFHLTFTPAEYEGLQAKGMPRFGGPGSPPPKSPPPKPGERELHRNTFGVDLPWARGTVTADGVAFPDVGVRYKGNGTFADAARTIKRSFRVDLDKHGGTARYHGLKALNLHCGVTDPAKCREALGYALFNAAGVPAPRTAFAEVRLTVPGKYDNELLGVYTLIEPVDRAFATARFGTDAGLLMKPEGVRDLDDRGDDWAKYKDFFRPNRDATPDEAKRLVGFVRLVAKADDAAFAKEIESYLDVDNYMRFLAVTSLIVNTDSFFALGHNFYLYLHPKTHKLHFVPWDVDRAFANFGIFGSPNRQMDLSLVKPYSGPHRLTERLLAAPGMMGRYQAILKELAAGPFSKEKFAARVTAADATVKDLRAKDEAAGLARKEPAGPAMGTLLGKAADLRVFVDKRTASVAAQLAGTSKGHVPPADPGQMRIGDFIGEPAVEELDADGDGMVSRAEWVAAAEKLYADSPHDDAGRVDEKGVVAGLAKRFPPPVAGFGGPPFRPGEMFAAEIVKRADADKDGKLTREELVAGAGELYDAVDAKKAGKLGEIEVGELFNKLFKQPAFWGPPPKKDNKDNPAEKDAPPPPADKK